MATLTLRYPSPIGVASGPLRQTPWVRIDSRVKAGSGSPCSWAQRAPAGCSSQVIGAPVASIARTVADTISGPIPSPRINVTVRRMLVLESLEVPTDEIAPKRRGYYGEDGIPSGANGNRD